MQAVCDLLSTYWSGQASAPLQHQALHSASGTACSKSKRHPVSPGIMACLHSQPLCLTLHTIRMCAWYDWFIVWSNCLTQVLVLHPSGMMLDSTLMSVTWISLAHQLPAVLA